jgi:hypothetical protein
MSGPYNIFLDDERFPWNVTWVRLPPVIWQIARDYDEFARIIGERGIPECVSFDHDLGDRVKTGDDCAKFLVQLCIDNGERLPLCFVHSKNPIGAENIQQTLKDFIRYHERTTV